MTPEQALQYWRNIKETIAPILEYAEEQSPEDYERIVNTIVLPEIFGDGTKVTLKHVAGLDGKLEADSIADIIGRNFNATDLADPVVKAVSYFHRHPIDEDGDIVVPVMFQRVGEEESSDLLVPLPKEYKAVDINTVKKAYFAPNFFGGEALGQFMGGAIYDIEKDAGNEDAASYAPVVDPDIYGDQPFFASGKIRAISDLGRAKILGCLTTDFEGQFRVVNPDGYFRSFPVNPLDNLRHPDLSGMISFYATKNNGVLKGRFAGGYFRVDIPFESNGDIVFREGWFFRSSVNHEMMHHFLYSHPHEDAVIKAESIAMARRMDDPMGPSILNYEEIINPEALRDPDGIPCSEPRPLDLVIISLNRFCSRDALAHNVTRSRYDDLNGKITDFAKADPESFRATISPIKRVAGSSLRNFAMVEAPLLMLETALEKIAKSNPDGCCSFDAKKIKKIGSATRSALVCLNFGLGAGLVSAAMEGGAAFLGSERFQSALKGCAAKTGFDQTMVCKKLEEGYQACQKLSPEAKQFVRQFLVAFANTAIGECIGQRSIFHLGFVYSAVYNFGESMGSSVLTGLFSAAFKQALRKVVGLGSEKAKVDHAGVNVGDVEMGAMEQKEDVEVGASVRGESLLSDSENEVRGATFVRSRIAAMPKQDGDIGVVDMDSENEGKGSQLDYVVEKMFADELSVASTPEKATVSPIRRAQGVPLLVRRNKCAGDSSGLSFQ